MPRRRNITPSQDLHIKLAGEDATKLELYLYSEAEQRVPFAARQRFFTERMREFFERASLDLALYFPALAPGSYVYSNQALVEHLKAILESKP